MKRTFVRTYAGVLVAPVERVAAHLNVAILETVRAKVYASTRKAGDAAAPLQHLLKTCLGLANAEAKRDPIRAIALVVALAAIVAGVWAALWPISAPEINVSEMPSTEGSLTVPTAPNQKSVAQLKITALLERPLFRRDRRPGLTAKEPALSEEQIAAARRATLEKYKLSGTLITGDYKAAILIKSGESDMILIKEGETLDGWKVDEISPRGIKLFYDNDSVEIAFPVVTPAINASN